MLVYRRVTGLAGHTSRVSELLEQVQRLSDGDPQVPVPHLALLSRVYYERRGTKAWNTGSCTKSHPMCG